MPLFILDTDHITLLQRGHPQVATHLSLIDEKALATTIITYEEQLRGRLAVVRQYEGTPQLSVAYIRLREMQQFFCAIRLLDFDSAAFLIFDSIRRQHRISTLDLRIAAIALEQGAVLVTRNQKDFVSINGLITEDWSAV